MLQVWNLNGDDIYAGETLESAVSAAMSGRRRTRDEVLHRPGFPRLEDLSFRVDSEDSTAEDCKQSIGEILAEMTGPGLIASSDPETVDAAGTHGVNIVAADMAGIPY